MFSSLLLIISFVYTLWGSALQTAETSGTTPLWVPIVLIVIVLLIFWWGLGRSSGSQQTATEETEQAEEAAKTPAAGTAPPSPKTPDDLTRIEGIGPKISQILQDAGITTFAALSATGVSDLQRIVKEEGGVRLAFPDTWPEQAKLAAAGEWEALDGLQEALKGGRRS